MIKRLINRLCERQPDHICARRGSRPPATLPFVREFTKYKPRNATILHSYTSTLNLFRTILLLDVEFCSSSLRNDYIQNKVNLIYSIHPLYPICPSVLPLRAGVYALITHSLSEWATSRWLDHLRLWPPFYCVLAREIHLTVSQVRLWAVPWDLSRWGSCEVLTVHILSAKFCTLWANGLTLEHLAYHKSIYTTSPTSHPPRIEIVPRWRPHNQTAWSHRIIRLD